jgi:hypothetical protein
LHHIPPIPQVLISLLSRAPRVDSDRYYMNTGLPLVQVARVRESDLQVISDCAVEIEQALSQK